MSMRTRKRGSPSDRIYGPIDVSETGWWFAPYSLDAVARGEVGDAARFSRGCSDR